MRIDVATTLCNLEADQEVARNAMESVQDQETAIADLSIDAAALDSEAYRASWDYLEKVRLPALRVHELFLDAYAADMGADAERLARLFADFGGVVDTDMLQERIDGAMAASNRIDGYAETARSILGDGPVASRLDELAESHRARAREAQEALLDVLEYAGDGSIYAGSGSHASALQAASNSILGVSYDPAAGTFDLSGAGDLSWRVEPDGEYWRRYNRQILGRYFILDADGNFAGVRPDASEELAWVGEALDRFSQGEDAKSVVDSLTVDQKYVLLWIAATFAPAVYERARGGRGRGEAVRRGQRRDRGGPPGAHRRPLRPLRRGEDTRALRAPLLHP